MRSRSSVDFQEQLEGLFLYGSAARGDDEAGSDLDLLGVTAAPAAEPPQLAGVGRARLSLYGREHLLQLASAGDLFAWHVVEEARPIWDPNGFEGLLRSTFQFADSYEPIRSAATNTAALLLVHPRSRESTAGPRIAMFALRSILYSRLAEVRCPLFGKGVVTDYFRDSDVDCVWNGKFETAISSAMKESLSAIVERYGSDWPSWFLDGRVPKLGELVGVERHQAIRLAKGLDGTDELENWYGCA